MDHRGSNIITDGKVFFLPTHPETVMHVWDVLLSSQGSAVLQPLLQLFDLNLRQTNVIRIGLKVELHLTVFSSSG